MSTPALLYISSVLILVLSGTVSCARWWSWDLYWFSKGVAACVFTVVLCESICLSGISTLGLGGSVGAGEDDCHLWTLSASYTIVSYLGITMLLALAPRGPFWRLSFQFILVWVVGIMFGDKKRRVPIPLSCVYAGIVAIGDIVLRHWSHKSGVMAGKAARNIRATTVMAWTFVLFGLVLQTLDLSLVYAMQVLGNEPVDSYKSHRYEMSKTDVQVMNNMLRTDYAAAVAHEFAPLRRLCFVAAAVHFHMLDNFYHIALENTRNDNGIIDDTASQVTVN